MIKDIPIVSKGLKPISIDNLDEYKEDKVDIFMRNWSDWFRSIEKDVELVDFREAWAQRAIINCIPNNVAAFYLGITLEDFQSSYLVSKK